MKKIVRWEWFMVQFSVIFLFLNGAHAQKKDINANSKPLFDAQAVRWEKKNGLNYLLVNTVLTNHSSDTLTFVSMSCSWQEFYATSDKRLSIDGVDCAKNVPILIKIAPQKTYERLLKVLVPNGVIVDFRLGFNLIRADSYQDIFYNSKILNAKNWIWSWHIGLT